MSILSERERYEVARANTADTAPVVFIHGMWFLASSWDRWRAVFEASGYVALAPSWPDDPETLEDARAHRDVFAGKRVQQITDHVEEVIGTLKRRPAIVGHSLGGLIAQKLAGMGLATATVAVGPAPFRGVLALPWSAVKAAFAVLRNPANVNRAVTLTFEQFRFAFANAISEREARELYEGFTVAASGALIFQVATANLNPATELNVDCTNPQRGPLLIVSGEQDNFIPRAMTYGAYKRQNRNPGVTVFQEVRERGHSLAIDSGWREVADAALAFVKQHHPAQASADLIHRTGR